jgi:transposase
VVTLEEWMEVKQLLNQGHSQRAVARLTGLSRNTVAKLAREPAPQPFRPPLRLSQLDPFKPYLAERFQKYPLSAVRLLAEIQPMGYTGSIDVLCRYLATLRQQQQRQAKATVRFETPPGQQAQADWAYCGAFPDPTGQLVKIYAFVMVLGFSRMLFVQFTTAMHLEQLLACHLEAFAYFGGWPHELLYDNMAQVKLPGGPTAAWNPLFLDFACYYGFTPRTCRVRRPRTKGKVERMVDYVKDNFLTGRCFVDLADLNTLGRSWLDQTANVRIHATTGQRPCDLLPKEELTALTRLAPYRLARKSARQVSAEGFVHLEKSRYSVPPAHVGQTVLVEVGEQRVIIRAGELVIAEHSRAPQPGACVVQPEHAAAFWQLCLPPERAVPPAPPRWEITFQEAVATRPLEEYARAAEGQA